MGTLTQREQDLLDALVNLQKQIHVHHKMDVKKDFSLMVADAQANKAIHNARTVGDGTPRVPEDKIADSKPV